MNQLLLAQLRGLSTKTIMKFVAELTKVLEQRKDSCMVEDAVAIRKLLGKNAKEDKAAGYSELRSYYNNQR